MKAYSVSELSKVLKACFENPAFSNIPVYGEVYSIRLGKFSYIDLGDQGSKQQNAPLLRCAFSCFYNNDYHLEDIKVGDVILIQGNLSYYPHGSSLTLWGNKVEILKSQEGKNLLAKRKTLEKLEKYGYLDEGRKRPIPKYCKKIAIITAENSAAYQDILKTLHGRFPLSSVLYPCIVQGEGAALSIRKALLEASKGDYDCILLGRGGGSKTDLSCFDDEKLAFAIAESKIPIITCIGHTIDTSIADRVSDKNAITPTEGASLINPSLEEVKERRESLFKSLKDSYCEILKSYQLDVMSLREKLFSLSPTLKLKQKEENLKASFDKLKYVTSSFLKDKEKELQQNDFSLNRKYEGVLQNRSSSLKHDYELLLTFDPKKIAMKGYAALYKDGKKIHSIKELKKDDEFVITYSDGRKKAKIIED